jgi:inner membrane protein
MDSVTQFALGAGVGMAVLGRRMGVRKAALTGGLLGSLPDADVFWPFDNAVDSFVLHRSLTHSLLIQTLATPVLGEGLRLVARSLRDARWQAWLAVFLCLTTHALLDAMTIYGTRLGWPAWPAPVGVGSIFIIDPLYTLPLLIVAIWGFFKRDWSRTFGRALTVALALSTAYLGWGLVAQQIAGSRAQAALARAGIAPERAFATPTPFNSLFWRVVAIDGPRYVNVYVPLLGGADAITAYAHPRLLASRDCFDDNGAMKTLRDFTKGFYRIDTAPDGTVTMTDLRMGLTPRYVFRFIVAEHNGTGIEEIAPQRLVSERSGPGDFAWIWAGIQGEASPRPAEAGSAIDLSPGTGASARLAGGAEPVC